MKISEGLKTEDIVKFLQDKFGDISYLKGSIKKSEETDKSISVWRGPDIKLKDLFPTDNKSKD